MSFSRIIIYVKQLPVPVKFSSLVYLGVAFGYNFFNAYVDAEQALIKYRNGGYHGYKTINSDWDAVKFGASENSIQRLWNSLTWPVSIAENIMPWIVLKLNPRQIEPAKND